MKSLSIQHLFSPHSKEALKADEAQEANTSFGISSVALDLHAATYINKGQAGNDDSRLRPTHSCSTDQQYRNTLDDLTAEYQEALARLNTAERKRAGFLIEREKLRRKVETGNFESLLDLDECVKSSYKSCNQRMNEAREAQARLHAFISADLGVEEMRGKPWNAGLNVTSKRPSKL